MHDMVSYPGTMASLNKHNWNKQFNIKATSLKRPILGSPNSGLNRGISLYLLPETDRSMMFRLLKRLASLALVSNLYIHDINLSGLGPMPTQSFTLLFVF